MKKYLYLLGTRPNNIDFEILLSVMTYIQFINKEGYIFVLKN